MAKVSHINIAGLDIELTSKPGLKNIYLRVKPPEGIISVSAPSGVSLELINEFISHNITSINQAREKLLSQPQESSSKQEYISGRKFYLWGKPYILDVRESQGKSYSVKFTGESIILTVPEISTHENCERALNELYRSELKRVLPDVIKTCSNRVGVQVNSFSVRNMKTCWGTCHIRKKHIVINLQLANKPPECLEYVVVHELVHLLEKNHTKRFHALVSKNFPDAICERRVKNLLAENQL
ncbi:MAG: M48 family metallopeptidase [Synergistaceae bacterium]|nr:M48 family metallopeptidase [Synergistaceae bacterium]